MGGGLESRCVGRVYGADVAARHLMRKMHGQTTLKFQQRVQMTDINPLKAKISPHYMI